MQLFLNATSPFARFARITALEKGLDDQLELVWCDPWNEDTALLAHNPLSRIPVLVTDAGQTISESTLIALYLNDLNEQTPLIDGANQAHILHLLGLGQGLMEAAFNRVIDAKYRDPNSAPSILDMRRQHAIQRSLEQLEKTIAQHRTLEYNLGFIALATALEYIDFRLPDYAIEQHFKQLDEWRKHITARPSFCQTSFT